MSKGVGVLVLVPVFLAFVSFLALVIGWTRQGRPGVRRVLLLVVVCAAVGPSSWLISSALHAHQQQKVYSPERRKLLAERGIDVGPGNRFDREVLADGAPFALFPVLAAALLGLRLRLLPSPSKAE